MTSFLAFSPGAAKDEVFHTRTTVSSRREGFSATAEIMRSSALAAALAAALCVLPAGHGHLGTAPGRFFAGVSSSTRSDAPPPPIPVNPGGGGNASCATAFSLNGSKYDVSALQVDVGGWVAENSVDKFSCAPNAPSLVCLHAAPSRASFGCPGRWLVWLRTAAGSADCINVCAVVTSERNCICYPCGATEYPASQVDKDPVKGETCEACEAQHQNDVVPLSQISLSLCAFCSRAPWPCRSRRAEEQHLVGQH
jgi:hypothetical protein